MSYDPNYPPQPIPYQGGYQQPYTQQYPPQQGWAPAPPPPQKKANWWVVIGSIVGIIAAVAFFGAAANNFAGKNTAGVTTRPPATGKPEEAVAQDAADPTTPDEPTDSDKQFDLVPGTVMTITDEDGNTQDAVIFSFKKRSSGCNGLGIDPQNGTYLIADVLVKQTKGTGAVNPLFFKFVGEDGTTADALGGVMSGCARNDLDSTNALRAGTKRAGQVVFDVSSTKGTVEYAPGGLGGEAVGSWKSN